MNILYIRIVWKFLLFGFSESLWMVSGWLELALLVEHYRIWNSEFNFSSFQTSSTYRYLVKYEQGENFFSIPSSLNEWIWSEMGRARPQTGLAALCGKYHAHCTVCPVQYFPTPRELLVCYQPHRQKVMPGQKSIYETFLVWVSLWPVKIFLAQN